MINTISPQEAAQWLSDGDAILIDVREASEFSAEHIAYAISLPLNDLQILLQKMNIPVTTKVIFHCLKGTRGNQACETIQGCGSCQNSLYNMEGGITAWKNAGLPTLSSATSPGVSIFRQVQMIIGGMITLFTLLGFMGLTFGLLMTGILGAGLFFSGLVGWCGLAVFLSKMPWNK